jgi:hypothetical protein
MWEKCGTRMWDKDGYLCLRRIGWTYVMEGLTSYVTFGLWVDVGRGCGSLQEGWILHLAPFSPVGACFFQYSVQPTSLKNTDKILRKFTNF